MKITWPQGHQFAFTIFDDTDWATLANVKPIYDLLATLGMRTTKSAWVFANGDHALNAGMSCEDPEYLAWLWAIQQQGFEIGLHNVAPGTSVRERICQGLNRFQSLFQYENIIHANHVGCLDNLYWGQYRISGWRCLLYNTLTLGQRKHISQGHKQTSNYFWGDLCQQRVRYVRNFVFNELNVLNICPQMPYHDPQRPFVNFWFASTEACNVASFLKNFTYAKIDQLVAQQGACIAYVHFADDFVQNGEVHPEVRKRLEYMAAQNGWFAPVSTVLDFLRKGQTREERIITPEQRSRLELRWLSNKILHGTS